jgi:hypothetical protein
VNSFSNNFGFDPEVLGRHLLVLEEASRKERARMWFIEREAREMLSKSLIVEEAEQILREACGE